MVDQAATVRGSGPPINLATGRPFKTGLRPTSAHKLADLISRGLLRVHSPRGKSPASFAMIPKQRDMFGNDQYGDCVTAEECFNISAVSAYCTGTAYMVAQATWMAFANKYNLLNGADLPSVIQYMQQDGMHQGSDAITDGTSAVVDCTNLAAIQNAISNGGGNNPNCLKIGIASSTLPSGAGNQDGWYAFGAGDTSSGEDHCIDWCGYGTAKQCFDALGVTVPSGVDPTKPDCLLTYTWSTIGVTDMAWATGGNNVAEGYIRDSTMLNGVPWTSGPTPSPVPPPPPGPTPTGNFLTLATALAPGTYQIGGSGGGLTPAQAAEVQQIQALAAQLLGQSAPVPSILCTILKAAVAMLCPAGGRC